MDKESSKKRGREDKKESSEINTASKKQDLNNNNNNNNTSHISFEDTNGESYKALSDKYLALGVFDFPWLKEGMISKSEEWKFEDTFSSLLNTTTGVEFYVCQTPVALVDFPNHERFDQTVLEGGGGGGDGLDCIWSSLLNQPLEPGVFN